MKKKSRAPSESKRGRKKNVKIPEINNNEIKVKVSNTGNEEIKKSKPLEPQIQTIKEEKKSPLKSSLSTTTNKLRVKKPPGLSLLIPLNDLIPKILSPGGSSSTLSASPVKYSPPLPELVPTSSRLDPPRQFIKPVKISLLKTSALKAKPKRTRAPKKLVKIEKEEEKEKEKEEELLLTIPEYPVIDEPIFSLQTRHEFAKNLPPLNPVIIKQENPELNLSIFSDQEIQDILHNRHLTAKYFQKFTSGNMTMDKNFTRLFNLFAPDKKIENVKNKFFDFQGGVAPGENNNLQVNQVPKEEKKTKARRPAAAGAAVENITTTSTTTVNAPGTMLLTPSVVPLGFELTGPAMDQQQFTGLRVDETLYLERYQVDEIMKILDSQYPHFCTK